MNIINLREFNLTPKSNMAYAITNENVGWVSDGYHTFDELYYHRMVLFAVICNQNKHLAWKSKLHSDGQMASGYFIVGINTPAGQATYHYQLDHWEKFQCEELPTAPLYDGHTPQDAIERIVALTAVCPQKKGK